LSLEGDVFRPSDEPGEVSFGLNVVADAEVARSFFEKRISLFLNFFSPFFSFDSFCLDQNNFTIDAIKIIILNINIFKSF
jgi:hypothetical protein